MQNSTCLSRRQILMSGLGAAALVIASRPAFAAPAEVEAELKKLFADKPMASGKIKLDIPQIAENGAVVPINFEVESPMTPADYVKSVHVFADGNPTPNVFSYHFTPEAGRAAGSNRIRLGKTQNIVAVAEMSDGKLYTAKSEVKVTIGGCG
ncbi:MAG: thiosulfate oxidation carrier protein SoxY [Rhodomicrobium sp.]|nr:thiosulfate oxidation carrier protein SoxY [Rhodomicrobium sp.]